jgi:hypothetical protein
MGGGHQVIRIVLFNIPQGVCARLLTATTQSEDAGDALGGFDGGAGATTLVSSGYIDGGATVAGIPGWSNFYVMNPTQAGWMCKYGSTNYSMFTGGKTVEPTSTPISGNVTVAMTFLVNA